VWFAPFPCDMTPERMPPFFAECAGSMKFREDGTWEPKESFHALAKAYGGGG
jgi:hypothetical protein